MPTIVAFNEPTFAARLTGLAADGRRRIIDAWRGAFADNQSSMNITIVTTGGTISKTFNEADGSLRNDRPVIETILAGLRLPDLVVTYRHVLSKDSLELTDDDRRLIVESVRQVLRESDAVVIGHGTDTLSVTGEMLHREFPNVPVPVILTGAMRPYEFRDSDAQQNVTEALLACRISPPGIYVAMHNRILRFPGVVKDRTSLSFVQSTSEPRTSSPREAPVA